MVDNASMASPTDETPSVRTAKLDWSKFNGQPLDFVNMVATTYHHEQQTFYLALATAPLPIHGNMSDNHTISVHPIAHVALTPSVMTQLLEQLQESYQQFTDHVNSVDKS